MTDRKFAGLNGCLAGVGVSLALIAPRLEAQRMDEIVVTATRTAERAAEVPADISVIPGSELRARGAADMATALSLVPGVEAPPGGDAGPSSAVPSFWGLHEFDAFLLVVDGIPWGGAFNPAITTLDFTDVERVEVLKGAAPVLYGATSFVGVVQLIHHPAGAAAEEADLAAGTYGSVRGSASLVLPPFENYRQSLAVSGQRLGFADARESVSNERLFYRGALDVGTGILRVDADVTAVRDSPPSPILRVGTGLTARTPVDANFNPADARIDENKYHAALGFVQPTALGDWDSLASFAYSDVTDVRAFLHSDLEGTADTQNQSRTIDDGYFDTHLTHPVAGGSSLIVGADLLYGRGRQTTLNGNDAYTVPLDGSVLPPPASAVPVNEIGTLDDRRLFAGQYLQASWKADERWRVDLGFRLNEVYEHKISSDLLLPLPPPPAAESVAKTIVRPTETLGVSYRARKGADNEVVVYADVRNAFKPAAVDFGPDYSPALLEPETARSYEIGVKGAAGAALAYQCEIFLLDFSNLVVATSSGALANAAGERLRGVEAEARYQFTPELALAVSAAYHNATFSQYLLFNGVTTVDVAGRQLALSPHVLASLGLLYTPSHGFTLTAVGRYVGRRYLDEENTAPVGGYSTLDANAGYAWGRYRVVFEGTNLTNRRPPVTSSEFGSESFYLLPARMLWLRVGYSWR